MTTEEAYQHCVSNAVPIFSVERPIYSKLDRLRLIHGAQNYATYDSPAKGIAILYCIQDIRIMDVRKYWFVHYGMGELRLLFVNYRLRLETKLRNS